MSEKNETPAVESSENTSLITKMLNAAKTDEPLTDETKAKMKKFAKRALIIGATIATVVVAVAVAKNANSTEADETEEFQETTYVEATENPEI